MYHLVAKLLAWTTVSWVIYSAYLDFLPLLRKGNIKLDSSFTGVKVDVEPADASSENTPDGKGAAGTSGNKDVHSLSFAND
jgi:hypothetical protein